MKLFKNTGRLSFPVPFFLCIMLLNSCAPRYQEFLTPGFDLKEWKLENVVEGKDQSMYEYVHPGENIDNWTELLTWQVLRKPADPEPIDAMVARVHAEDTKSCPDGFAQNIIALGSPTETEEASILYEWWFKNCPQQTDQHEIAKIIYGKFSIFRIAYVAKIQSLPQEKKEKWIKELSEAKIIIRK